MAAAAEANVIFLGDHMWRIVLLSVLLAKTPCFADTLGSLEELECPCRVMGLDMFLDGGTLGGVLEDAEGSILKFCLDGRMIIVEYDSEGKPLPIPPTHYFIGADHPAREGARPLDVDGEEERLLTRILREWIESVLPAKKYEEVFRKFDSCTNAEQQERLCLNNNLSEEQLRALRINKMILNREVELGIRPKN